jgi:hypothetical protein
MSVCVSVCPYCHSSGAQWGHVPWLAHASHAIWNVRETSQLTRKTEVTHEDSRAFAMGDVPIKGVSSELVSLLVSQSVFSSVQCGIVR